MKKLKPFNMKHKDTEHLFEMANVLPDKTGLTYRIWIFYKTNREGHGPRIKADVQGRDISVSISENPLQMDQIDVRIPHFRELQDWIKLNKELLLQYWESEGQTMDAGDAISKLRKLP
jgi:hypothetical protein